MTSRVSGGRVTYHYFCVTDPSKNHISLLMYTLAYLIVVYGSLAPVVSLSRAHIIVVISF